MLPDVEHKEGGASPLSEVLVLFGLQDDELSAERLPGEYTPARAFDSVRRGQEVFAESLIGAEVLIDLGGNSDS